MASKQHERGPGQKRENGKRPRDRARLESEIERREHLARIRWRLRVSFPHASSPGPASVDREARLVKVLRWAVLLALSVSVVGQGPRASSSGGDVLQARLRNGLRVVIVRDRLAPVVSTDLTYLVGSRDDPAGVPGMAHAQEHMMFRGTRDLSTRQLGTIATALGGNFNAQTTETTTHYQFTVPSADFDAVLRIESDRMRGVLDAQSEWQNERGAIEQEVLRDESIPGADFFRSAQALAYAATPYAHDGVGTKAAFDKLTGPELKAFHDRWYAPNNAVLVVAGDVDPGAALAQIRARFESIPSHPVPAHAVAHLRPLQRAVLARPTTLVYPLAAVGFRFPGVDDPDFVASFVLQGILDAERGPIHALADRGEALGAQWTSEAYVSEAQLGFAVAALRPGGNPVAAAQKLQKIVQGYAQNGVPRELFESTKRRLIAGQEESRNSTAALASDWATTIVLDREPSIAREQDLIRAVTLADVNRVAKRYLDPRHAIVGELTPSANATQNAPPAPPQTGSEKPLVPQSGVVQLPPWGEALLHTVSVPPSTLAPSRFTLPNGIALIVQPETISNSVFVYGQVKSEPALEEPAGKEGVSGVLDAIYPYGTRSLDRTAFARALDDVDAQLHGGAAFAMEATPESFARAVTLTAQNELQPRFDQATFQLARARAIDEWATAMNSSTTVARLRAATYLLPAGDPELRRPTIESLRALTLGDVEDYYAKTMRPDRTTIVVIGNVTPETARATIERAFGSWRATAPAADVTLPPLPRNTAGDVSLPLPTGQDSVTFQQIVPLARTAPEVYPLLLGTAILGGGSLGPEQSRLFRDLRQEAGLVYTVDARLVPRRSRYEFSIEFASLPSNEQRIAAMIDAEIERMKTEPVSDFELALAKASIVRQSVIGRSSTSAIGGALLDEASNGLPFDQPQIDARALLATDARAIQQAFAGYIDPRAFVRTVQGPVALGNR
jgi:zinc protease